MRSWADIDAIVFDLFDTLVDLRFDTLPHVEINGVPRPSTLGVLHERVVAPRGISFDALVRAVASTDRVLRSEYYDHDLELPTRLRFQAIAEELGDSDPSFAQAMAQLHMATIVDQAELPAHHPELLARLRSGRKLALCSNFSDAATAVSLLEDFGLFPHLDVVVISETVGIRKPRPEIFEAVLSELGVSPAATLHVGDSLSADVGGAARLGIGTCWVTRCIREPEETLRRFQGDAPELRVGDLAELEAILGSRPDAGAVP